MPSRLRTNILSGQDLLDSSTISTRPIQVVSDELTILDYDDDRFDPYDSAPKLNDKQIESNFGRRFQKRRK